MKWARRVDGPQAEIVSALRRIGVSVFDASRAGSGFPDLVCGYRGRTWLLEVKADGGSLTPAQEEFHRSFRGEAYIIRSVSDAINLTRTITGSTT